MSDPAHDSLDGFAAVRLVAGREIRQRLRDRSLLISTAISVVVLLGVILIPQLLKDDGPPHYTVGVVGAAALGQALETTAPANGVTIDVRSLPDAAAADRAVRAGDVRAAVVDDGGRVLVKKDLPAKLGTVLQAAARDQRTAAALTAAGVDPQVVARAATTAAPAVVALTPDSKERDTNRAIALVGVILLYGQLIGYGMWVALGVVEEKSSRVVEVLLSTIRPRQLLAGKVLGIGLLGLGQLLLIGAIALVAGVTSGAISLPATAIGTIVQLVLWFVLGFAFFATLFAAGAALVSRQEEVQNATGTLTFVMVAAFFLALQAVQTPDGTLARVFSFVPPFSAMVMPSRFAGGGVALWQVGVAVVIMVATTLLLVRLAARLYEGGVLRMGARVSWRTALASSRAER